MEVLLAAIELCQSSFCEAPERFNAIDMSSCCSIHKGLTVIHANMFVIANIDEAIISPPFVCRDNTLRINSSQNNGPERLSSAVRNDLCVHRSSSLKDAEHRLLVCSPSTLPRNTSPSLCTKIALITFYSTNNALQLSCAIPVNGISKQTEVSVDCIAIQASQLCCFCRIYIDTEVTKNFSNLVSADFGLD